MDWVTIVWLCSSLAGLATQDLPREEHEERERGRLPGGVEFRFRQRLSEDGTLPPDALMTAKRQRDLNLAASLGIGGEDTGSLATSWQWLGPGNIGGRIRAILVHPTQPTTIWVGSISGGVWKTTNGGTSWAPLNDFMPSLTVSCMVMDPTNPDVHYVGTGEGFFNSVQGTSNTAAIQGAGVFKTTDGGQNYTQLGATATADWYFVNRLAISPSNPQVLLAATATGLWRTTDGGASWTSTLAARCLDVRFHPTDGTKAVCSDSDGDVSPTALAYHSTDGGVTWTAATGITGGTRIELAYAKSLPTTVYAGVTGNNGMIRVWRSQNGGVTWTLQSTTAGISTYDLYNNTLWVDPTDPNRLVLGGVNIYRSVNAGAAQSSISSGIHPDHHFLVEHPGYNGTTNRIVLSGNDGGIHRANDIAATTVTWQELNNNLGITQFYGAAVNPTSGVVVGGTQDNGSLRFTGNTETWNSWFGGDGGFCAADPTDPNYFYGEIYYLQIFRSTNGGASGSYITSGITGEGASNFISHFILDPNNPNRMFGAGVQVWRTNNVKAGTPTWSSIKPPLINCLANPFAPPGGPPVQSHFDNNNPCNHSTIAVAEGNSDIVWVGHNSGDVYRTSNGTAAVPAWTRVDQNGVGLPNRWISRIAIDRNNHSRVYVSLMGYHADNLWRTEDNGLTWVQLTGAGATSLPAAPVSCVTLHRLLPGWLYAATDIGIFTSTDDGGAWTASNQGPANVCTDELVWKNNRDLMAVTHGRGIFLGRSFDDCNNNLVPDSQDIANLTSADLNLNGIPDECEVGIATPVGAGCGISGPPVLSATAPRIGLTQTYSMTGAAPNSSAWLVIAIGPPSPSVLGPGCTAQVALVPDPAVIPAGATNGAGGWSFPLAIPNAPALVPLAATGQAIVAVAGGPLGGAFEISNGLSMVVGF